MPNSVLPYADGRLSSPELQPTIWVEVARGRTRYPRRPVDGDRFLIGGASNCHLQLGGDNIPFLHSMLQVERGQVTIEAFVRHPELRVNGHPVRSSNLCDGDSISIGPFELTLHLQATLETCTSEADLAPIPLDLEDAAAESPEALSAAELVARIESADSEVETFERAQRTGAAALLDAIRFVDADESAVDAGPVLHELQSLSDDLVTRLETLRQRERSQVERADLLLSAQDRLAEQLRLAAESLAQEQARVRASA